MERTVDIATGESVTFSYELAGLGSRFFAVFIDMTVQVAVATAVILVVAALGSGLPDETLHGSGTFGSSEKIAQAIVVALFVIFFFLLFFGYFIFFEWRFEGRTPGKRVLGIRVVRDGGFPLDFTAAVVRNVVRILELGLGFYAISAVSTLISPLNRRLGDFAAGTIVVRENRFERAAVSSFSEPFGESAGRRDDAVVRNLSDAERELVRRYFDRRPSLSASARAAVAAEIAGGIRPKLGATFAHLDDDHLLCHLAGTALH